MKCPVSKIEDLQPIQIKNISVDACSNCKGIWFDNDELRKVKDYTLKEASWLDADLWEDESKFLSVKSNKSCPKCTNILFKINYGDSTIEIDACKYCKGIWLDGGDFGKVIRYIKDKTSSEVLSRYTTNLIEEAKEIFTGPETRKSEIVDLIILLDFFKYKFMTEHEKLSNVLINLPK